MLRVAMTCAAVTAAALCTTGPAGVVLGATGSARVALAAQTEPVPSADFYVSPQGKDTWSGKLAAPRPDGSDGPLASLTGARDAVRRLKAQGGGKKPILVLLRGGVYRVAEPVVFAPEDSGTADAPIAYAAYPGETPIQSGGVPIGGWKKGTGPLWTAEVPEVKAGQWYFRTLYVDGRRATPARTPNEPWFTPAGPIEKLDRKTARNDPKTRQGFRFSGDEIKPWDGLDDAVLVYYHCWTTSRHRIMAVEPEAKIVRLSNSPNWPFGWWGKDERYYVEYVAAALDAPGEWHLDRRSGVLSYYPRPGEDMTRAAVLAPRPESLLRLAGDAAAGKTVDHLRFEGLSFQHTDWTMPKDAPVDRQSAAFLSDATVLCRGARHCAFVRCEIAHTSGYGLWFERGAQDCRAEQCHLHDLGAGGVRIGENSLPKQPAEQCERNAVVNCFLHDGGRVFHAGCGVLLQKSSHNKVQNNEICDFLYSGVSAGWSWGYAPSEANHNLIERNHIHHLGYGQLSDMGGIYCLGISPGTRLAQNHIHDIWAYTYGGWGLYTDEGSTDIVIENNVVYRVKDACFHQHYGKENVVRNNVLAFAASYGQVRRSREEEHRSFTLERNIILCDGDVPLLGGNWKNGNFACDANLYWHAGGKPAAFPGGLDLAQWQARGFDRQSVVADPRFADAKNGDFRLLGDSPALKLGFRPIDMATIGLTGPPEWVALPAKVRRPPLPWPQP